MAEIITYWGYIALFVGTILEGESFLATGAMLAGEGYLEITWVATVSMLGAFSGEWHNFCFFPLPAHFFGRSRFPLDEK